VDEIPYDFVRKRLSVVAANARGHERTLITKGALDNALSVCNGLQRGDVAYPL
jgi:Mg2+-importing ATPase